MLRQSLLVLALASLLLLVTTVRGDCLDYKEGDTWQTGLPECAEYTCKNGMLKGKTCPLMKVSGNCKVKAVPAGAKFPDCCPAFECP